MKRLYVRRPFRRFGLGRLLAQALDACVRPAELRDLVQRAAAGGEG